MSADLDTKMMKAAETKAVITGLYHSNPFVGIVTSSRQHTQNFREVMTVELTHNCYALVPCQRVIATGESIIISARDIEAGMHVVDGL